MLTKEGITMDEKIREYQESVASILRNEYFPTDEGYTIKTGTVRKNNGVQMHSINILTGNQPISPTFYVEDYFESHTAEATAQELYELYQKQLANQIDMGNNKVQQLCDWDYVKDIICFKLINRQKNEKDMADYPYKVITNDLMLVFYLQVEKDATALINNSMAKLWGIENDTANTLLEYAEANTEKLHPVSFRSINEVLREMLPIEFMDIPDAEAQLPLYVLTNRDKVNGAGALLYRNGTQLQDCMEEMKKIYPDTKGVFILPSSVHEVLIIPDSKAINVDENTLINMVREVNATEVEACDFLSDNILYYSQNNGFKEISFAQKEIAR